MGIDARVHGGLDGHLEAGCRQWTYPGPRGPTPGGYYRPPDEAHEEPEAMRPWAELGLESALRKARTKGGAGAARKAKEAPAAARRGRTRPPGPAAPTRGSARVKRGR